MGQLCRMVTNGISNQIYFKLSKKLTVMDLSVFYVRCFKVFRIVHLFITLSCHDFVRECHLLYGYVSVCCEKKSLMSYWTGLNQLSFITKLQDLFEFRARDKNSPVCPWKRPYNLAIKHDWNRLVK